MLNLEKWINNKESDKYQPKILDIYTIKDFIYNNICILFPNYYEHYNGNDYFDMKIIKIENELTHFLSYHNIKEDGFMSKYFEELIKVNDLLEEDLECVLNNDPSCKSKEEVILSYPGFLAIIYYRIANILVRLGIPIVPRIISNIACDKTGIDIHPNAKIGKRFFIDHGCGIVIGETAEIGDNVSIYHGVTLGSLSINKEERNVKRHPTILDNVTIYSNASILGGETVVGEGSIIGCNVIVTKSVKPNSIITINSNNKLKNI
jgi:serine O-acetyltransferase